MKTRNVWQSLAYSPFSIVVSPPSEYLWNTPPNYWSPHCIMTPPPRKRSWTKRGKIIDAGRTTSYVLNSGVAILNLRNFYKMYRNDCHLTCWNRNCDIPLRFRTPACRINDYRQISAKSRHNFHFLQHLNSTTAEPIFTNFLHYVQTLLEQFTRAFTKRYCKPSCWPL